MEGLQYYEYSEAGKNIRGTKLLKRMKLILKRVASDYIKELEIAGLIMTERKGKYLSAKVKKETLAEVSNLFIDKLKNK
ncbi:hypothetical protein Ga0466249_000537 [Sporomusaceae bacterium BoRhaA]|nr:hypothetical protein [Pelorhabdus rhamnosifermentans]